MLLIRRGGSRGQAWLSEAVPAPGLTMLAKRDKIAAAKTAECSGSPGRTDRSHLLKRSIVSPVLACFHLISFKCPTNISPGRLDSRRRRKGVRPGSSHRRLRSPWPSSDASDYAADTIRQLQLRDWVSVERQDVRG